MEIILVLILIVAGLTVAAVLFCGWIIVSIGRGFARLVIPDQYARRPQRRLTGNEQSCTNDQCACDNPGHARFCRRCGKSLPNLMRIVSSRAAML